jgi:hypothetical protein
MKRLFLVLMAVTFFTFLSVPTMAGCYLGVNITPDPSGAAIDQELWANPDGVADNGDEYLGVSLAGDAVTGNFIAIPDCSATPAITLFVKSHFPGGVELISNEVIPSEIGAAVLGLALKYTTP